jgi:hypothetical protein
MRRLAIVVLLAGIIPPAVPQKRRSSNQVTVEQLEQQLTVFHRQRDEKAARSISDLELTERMSAARFAHAEAEMPGPASREALLGVFDAAEFLDLPVVVQSSDPAPGRAAQVSLFAQTAEYVSKTIARLPNLFATEYTTRFEGKQAVEVPPLEWPIGYEPLHEVSASRAEVLYRDGHESVNLATPGRPGPELSTLGEFGSILVVTLADTAKGKVVWSHWEQGAAGRMAVFRYQVPQDASHYAVAFPGFLKEIIHHPAYHGEIAVNPTDGSILRLTMVAELKADDPVVEADILVEYGSVEIGEKMFIGPLKSVALAKFRDPGTYQIRNMLLPATALKTQVNNTVFRDYHLYWSERRILPLDGVEPNGSQPASGPATSTLPAPAPTPNQ